MEGTPAVTASRRTLLAALALCGGVFLLGYTGALFEPFFSDDYILLDKVRRTAVGALFSPSGLAYGYWRPWSRELHYWLLDGLSGGRPWVFHVASLALWLTALGLYWSLCRRLASTRAATVALAGVLALAAWGVPLHWAPAAQDLWMLVFSLLCLHSFARGRDVLAAVALAFALMSKELAAIVPLIAFAMTGRSTSWKRFRPMLVVLGTWALVHPALGGRWLWPDARAVTPTAAASPALALVRSLLSVVNLDLVPRPMSGWMNALALASPAAMLLFFAVLRPWGAEAGEEPAPRAGAVRFGFVWAAIAWLPLAAPSLLWQPYYALLGALGLWLAIGAWLERRTATAATIVAAIALLRVARDDTPTREWGNERLMAFGRSFMAMTEGYLAQAVPPPAPHARLYFTSVPRGVVFITGRNDAPALRVWYRDTTVQGGFWSDYRMRDASGPRGRDFFFRYDSLNATWMEIVAGTENLASTRTSNLAWQADHEGLALTFTNAGDVRRAAPEYVKLADTYPDRADYAYLAALSFEAAGDSISAARWYQAAAQRPGADPEMISRARSFQRR